MRSALSALDDALATGQNVMPPSIHAARVASMPRMPSPPRRWRGRPRKPLRSSSLPKIATAQRRPAMLNAFEAEVRVTVRASASGESACG